MDSNMKKIIIANTASKVAASISTAFVSHRDVSLLNLDRRANEIAEASMKVATHLADKLEKYFLEHDK